MQAPRKIKKKAVIFLRWTEKFTKTDMVYLASGGFWSTTNYFVQFGLGLVVTIALANFLPKESLGTYQFILSVAGILSVLTLSGLGSAITRAVAQGKDGVLISGLKKKLQWSIGITLASGVLSAYYFINGNNTFALAFLVVGVLSPFIESFKLYDNFLQGKEAFRDSVLLGAWRKPLPALSIIIAAWLTSDVLLLILVYFLSNAISYGAVYYKVIQKYRPPTAVDIETITLGKHLSILNVFNIITLHADKILIWHFLGSTAVASFTIAQLASRYSGTILNSLSAIVLPRVSKRDLQTLKTTLPRKVRLFSFFMLAGTVVYILIAPLIMPVLFPQYTESVALTQLLALGILFIPRKVYAKVFVAHRQTRPQYILAISGFVSRIILLYILIPLFGVWGAAYALLLSELMQSILVRHLFHAAKNTL
ncbi:hypothetical protein CL638_01680 [bacterium]|nr:hypothetical protein [bacterium]